MYNTSNQKPEVPVTASQVYQTIQWRLPGQTPTPMFIKYTHHSPGGKNHLHAYKLEPEHHSQSSLGTQAIRHIIFV